MRAFKSYLLGIAIFCIFLTFQSTSLAQNLRGQSLYSDHKASKIGDVVTILVIEQATASSKAQTATKKDNGISANAKAGKQDFKPLFGLSGDSENTFSGTGQTERQGTLKARISAEIIKVRDSGNLEIQGSRELDVNGEKETITITGIIRPVDISADNTVYSYNVAEAKISYKGKGTVHGGQRPGLLARLFNWIF